jgi:hypothetical protein
MGEMAELDDYYDPDMEEEDIIYWGGIPVWETREGELIPVPNMKKSHLINALNYAKKNWAGSDWIEILENRLTEINLMSMGR